MLTVEMTENPSRGIIVTDENGKRAEILRVTCSIRPANGVYLNIDVHDIEKTTANMQDVTAQLTEFAAEAFRRAASMGLPVPIIGDTNA